VLTCSHCGRDFDVRSDHRKYVSIGVTLCSLTCLRLYVDSRLPLTVADFEGVGTNMRLPAMNGETYYSVSLGQSFRSEYEGMFAEVMVFGWGWGDIRYENHVVRLKNTIRKIYIPDFFRETKGVWLEVKGEFLSGSKKKFLLAHEQLQGRVILVGPNFYNDIRREAMLLRRHRLCSGG